MSLKCQFEDGCDTGATCVDISLRWMCLKHVNKNKIFYEVSQLHEEGFEIFRVVRHSVLPINDFSTREKAEACAFQGMSKDNGLSQKLRQEKQESEVNPILS